MAEIEGFLTRKSKDIDQLFRKGLIFDIVLKSIIGLSLLGIIYLFKNNLPVILVCATILLGITWAIRFQWLMIRKIPEAGASDPTVRTTLENKINFYHQRYIKSLYVGALSNALLILSGMLYYFYFKYGEIRPFQWDDYLVFSAAIIIGFALGAYVQIAQHNFQVKQLESCLNEIDEDAISTITLREQRNRKRRLILIFLLAIICGLLILAYLIFR
ncbi:MAG: hypothetical protein U9R49_14980 [Bacteroidota bacterium]|nr:hypothetical protein [Bacteroidota bacterium]